MLLFEEISFFIKNFNQEIKNLPFSKKYYKISHEHTQVAFQIPETNTHITVSDGWQSGRMRRS